MRDDLRWVELPETGDPALAEWLEGASCSPRVKALAARAADAAGRGVSAAQWRHDLLAEHPDASALVAEAEECMRGAGLWPWHDHAPKTEHHTRLDTVAAWRDAPYYTPRERASLAWCEALTELPHTGAPDEVYAAVEAEFSGEEIAALTFAIVAINGWNRLAVGLRTDVLSLDGLDLPDRAAPRAASGGA